MSRRSVDPRLNASLIREGRMIFNQLTEIFGNRQPRTTSFNDVLIAEAEAKKARAAAPALKCAVCLAAGTAEKANQAITIANGDAVCLPHLAR